MPKVVLFTLPAILLGLPMLKAQQPDPKKAPPKAKADDAWIKQVQQLAPEKQVAAVIGKLKELNPGLDLKNVFHKIENGAVTELNFATDAITDISPVRALTRLTVLHCNGSGPGKGKLADLTPIKGLPLVTLNVGWTQVSDLSVVKGMALNWLSCGGTRVTDISVIKGMPITVLHCQGLDPDPELLRSLKKLQWINNLAAAEYYRQLAAFQPDPKKELSVTGVLSAKNEFDLMRPGCHHKVHKVNLKADVEYVIDLMRFPASNLDPYLRLEDDKGVQLAEDDDRGGNQNAALVFAPKKTGTYRLMVTTCDQGQTGRYLLEVQPLNAARRPGRVLNPLPSGFYNFPNNQLRNTSPADPKRPGHPHTVSTYPMLAGTRYHISLNPQGGMLSYLRLEDAAGNKIDEDFTRDGFQFTWINFQPKDSGTYRIIVSSTNPVGDPDGSGYYYLNVSPGQNPPARNAVRHLYLGGYLAKDGPRDADGRHYKDHAFLAKEGTRYAINMSTNEVIFGPALHLEDPDGKKVKGAEDSDPEDVQRPLIVFQPKKSGTYKVVASTVEPGKLGGYNLQIRPLSPAEPAPKKQFISIQNSWNQITVNDPEDKERKGCRHKVQLLRMKGGVRYLLDAPAQQFNNEYMDICLRVEDSKGKILARDDLTAGNDDPRIIFVPKKTDTYRLVVTTFEPGALGQYNLTARALVPGESPPPANTSGYFPPSPPQGREFGVSPWGRASIVFTPLPQPAGNFGGGNNQDEHGYVEFRFRIENRSEDTHRVQLTMPRYRNRGRGWGYYLQALKRSVEVGPKAAVTLSLFQPDLNLNNADVEVEIDGQVQRDSLSFNLNSNRGQRFNAMHGGSRTNLLHILAPAEQVGLLGQNVFKTAVSRPPTSRRGNGSTGSSYKGIAYTYHMVHQFHGLPLQGKSWSTSWLGYSAFDGVVLSAQQLKEADPEVQNALWQYVECGGSLLVLGEGRLPESWQHSKVKGKSWTAYYPGFGQCLVFPGTRIRALTPEQWHVIADMWDQSDRAWNLVRSPSEAQREFPAVDNIGIPVRSLFVVMLVFAVLIGPVNIRVLTRKKRRIWLLWTVPAFSLLTCVLIVGFMFLSEGWQAKARAEGLTVLDESAQRASSLSWLSLYTPTAASDGLHFSQDTEITPHLRMDRYSNQRNPRTMEWTNDQHLESGWIAPRLPVHFMVRTAEKRLERVLVRRGNDGLTLTNGLKAPLKTIWLADLKGRVFKAENVPEGSEAVLKQIDMKIETHPGALRRISGAAWHGLGKYCAENPEKVLRPGCYLAILDGAPFLEKGLSGAQLRPEPTAVFGIMKEPL